MRLSELIDAALIGLVALVALGCGSSTATPGTSPSPMQGFHFAGGTNQDIVVDGSVRCIEASHTLYVSAPDPVPTATHTKVVSIIVHGYAGTGTYRNLTDNSEDQRGVLVELLDYSGPHDYTILAVGNAGYVTMKIRDAEVTGTVDGTLRGTEANSVKGSWLCRLSEPSAMPSVTAAPSAPAPS